MVDITHLYNPNKVATNTDPAEVQFKAAMEGSGLTPPNQIILDGEIHRFKADATKKGFDRSGWYVGFSDGIPSGAYGDWRVGLEATWVADVGREVTLADKMAHQTRIQAAKKKRDAEQLKKNETTASIVDEIWNKAGPASADHPYLKRKDIQPHMARITGDGRLMVPLLSDDGTLASIQYISDDGDKKYHPGGAVTGKFAMLGTMDVPGVLYIAEGFATAATIHEISGRPCVVAYSASNLVAVAGILRGHMDTSIVIVADNDENGIGKRYAEQASAKYGINYIVPPIKGDANDYVASGGDLDLLLNPPSDEWMVPFGGFSSQTAPLAWYVKGWLQKEALVMIHGPSGCGKTFLVLDWCLHMAAGRDEWMGKKVRTGFVAYLAGEGHHGLRGRGAAWMHFHGVDSNIIDENMFVSKSGCDLNEPLGYQKVVEALRDLPKTPDVVVVDTLHRFLSGDENSAQDAKTMLDACAAIMLEFGCTVILVHHTGVSDEAQHRARGSSAWRGALDIEISVKPGDTIEVSQKKSKDAEMVEPAYIELQSVEIPGWLDEDGEPVTSAVVVGGVEVVKPKKDSALVRNQKTFSNAWLESAKEELDNLPHLSRSELVRKLEGDGLAERTIKNMINPSYDNKLIGSLLLANMIKKEGGGWTIIDNSWASIMMVSKNG